MVTVRVICGYDRQARNVLRPRYPHAWEGFLEFLRLLWKGVEVSPEHPEHLAMDGSRPAPPVSHITELRKKAIKLFPAPSLRPSEMILS